jgi:CcmD family protein
LDNLAYLFAAYTAIWVILFSYTWHLGRRQYQLEKDLKRLENQLNSTASQ